MPATNLRVALIPIDIKPGDHEANLDFVARKMDIIGREADLVVLPEMFNTGYTTDPALACRYAEDAAGGPSISRLKALAAAHDCAIWGTITAIGSDGKLVNRGVMVAPDGTTEFYDKRHLFILGREPELYSPGMAEAPIVEFRGWKLKMSICYDLRFPVWNRWTPARPYDALIIPANWPDARALAWQSLLVARAIENQAYVVGCNRLGSDPYGEYRADISYIFNHWGDDCAIRTADDLVFASFDGPALERDRARFPNLAVADSFSIRTGRDDANPYVKPLTPPPSCKKEI